MTTAADWVEDTRSWLEDGNQGAANRLGADYTPGSGTLTCAYDVSAVAVGSVVTVGLNSFRVWAVNPTSKQLVVSGGSYGTTDVTASTGDIVRVNPRFTEYRIMKALNEELAALSNPRTGLWQIKTTSFTWTVPLVSYPLPDDCQRVQAVFRDTYGPQNDWPRVPRGEWREDHSAPSSDFATGKMLRIDCQVDPGREVWVQYQAKLASLSALTDDVSLTGLHAEAWDIPSMGAALRLMVGREIPRNNTFTQGDTRRADEVPAGAVGASIRPLAAQRAQRIQEEAARLRQLYPITW